MNNDVRITEINIDAFIMYLQFLIKNNQLENHYNEKLKAYEFKLNNFELGEHGIRNYLIEKSKVFT